MFGPILEKKNLEGKGGKYFVHGREEERRGKRRKIFGPRRKRKTEEEKEEYNWRRKILGPRRKRKYHQRWR